MNTREREKADACAFAHPECAFQVSHDFGEGMLERERTRRECFQGKARTDVAVPS